MATSSPIILPAMSWWPAPTLSGLLSFYSGAATNRPVWLLDGSAENKGIVNGFRVPANFASAPVLYIDWMSGAADQSQIPALTAAVVCVAAAEDLDGKSLDAVNTATDETTPADYAAHDLVQSYITLTNNDTMAAGEYCTITLYVNNTNWTLTTGPCMFLGGVLEYVTT